MSALTDEFDRQTDNLMQKNYPLLAKISQSEFLQLSNALKKYVSTLSFKAADFENGYLPFVVVVQSKLIKPEIMMSQVRWNDKNGLSKLFPKNADDFTPTAETVLPENPLYILVSIERGKEYLNVTPHDALIRIKTNQRIPPLLMKGLH